MRYLALITMTLLLGFNLHAQDYGVISKAFSDGNATELGRLFDAAVEYSVDGATSNLDRSEAENKMRSFFIDNEPRNFEIVHKGVSKHSDVHYCIAQLSSSGGNYRVMLYLHKSMDTYLIQSIEIEND